MDFIEQINSMISKANEPFNFKQWQPFNVESIKGFASGLKDEWLIDTSRQDTFPAHKDTVSYFLYKTNLLWKYGSRFEVAKQYENKDLDLLIDPIIKKLEELHNGKHGNVLFIKLLANKTIPGHTDGGDYLNLARRHHIPIITSENTSFGVGDEEIAMHEGECWEINNSRLHYVNNFSNVDRIHLLIDIMPNSIIGIDE